MIEFVDVSMSRIATLNSIHVASATNAFQKCISQRIPIYITWGSRTMQEQELLYRFGRSLPGPIVTHRRPGYSPHNYGLALDFCLLDGKKLLSWEDCYPVESLHEKWMRVVKVFEAEGWTAGWRWPSFEPGHLENLMGLTIGDLHKKYTSDEDRNYRN